jgi:hypothetical protein
VTYRRDPFCSDIRGRAVYVSNGSVLSSNRECKCSGSSPTMKTDIQLLWWVTMTSPAKGNAMDPGGQTNPSGQPLRG